MTKVKFDYTDNGKALILTVDGHADADEKGKDLICASASILAYTVAQVVSDMHKDKKLKKKPTVKLEDGSAIIVCKPNKDAYAEALHTYFVAQVGYNLLAHNFPENVQLTPFGKA